MPKGILRTKSLDGMRHTSYTEPTQKVNYFTRLHNNLPWKVIAIVMMGMVLSATTYLVFRTISPKQNLSGRAELQFVEKEISKHYILPKDEEPALATVTDKSKLTTPFFKRTEDGDKILIYQKNKIAIIYRPSIDRIVGVGPVEFGTPASQ